MKTSYGLKDTDVKIEEKIFVFFFSKNFKNHLDHFDGALYIFKILSHSVYFFLILEINNFKFFNFREISY